MGGGGGDICGRPCEVREYGAAVRDVARDFASRAMAKREGKGFAERMSAEKCQKTPRRHAPGKAEDTDFVTSSKCRDVAAEEHLARFRGCGTDNGDSHLCLQKR